MRSSHVSFLSVPTFPAMSRGEIEESEAGNTGDVIWLERFGVLIVVEDRTSDALQGEMKET